MLRARLMVEEEQLFPRARKDNAAEFPAWLHVLAIEGDRELHRSAGGMPQWSGIVGAIKDDVTRRAEESARDLRRQLDAQARTAEQFRGEVTELLTAIARQNEQLRGELAALHRAPGHRVAGPRGTGHKS
jgi:hypothetical protein